MNRVLQGVPVSEQEAEELLHELVVIPSLSREEQAASHYLAHWMGDHGFSARVDDVGNAIGERGRGHLLVGYCAGSYRCRE